MKTDIVGIVGTGRMGKGIAEAVAAAGMRARLVKCTAGDTAKVRDEIARSLSRAVERKKLDARAAESALANLECTSDRDALGGCDLVVESVIEDLGIKQSLVADLEGRIPATSVIATNTSSLRVSEVGARLRSPSRLLGVHFFSPVPAMKLVEIAPSQTTAPFAVERARDLVLRLGKTPVVVGDSSGYIVNRLLVPYLIDGMLALEAGLASADDIDRAMQLGCGHPMGPLALADFIGLDVVYAMARTLYTNLRDRRYSPPGLLRRLVLAGHHGKKTGMGVFDYRSDPPRENAALRLIPEGEGVHSH